MTPAENIQLCRNLTTSSTTLEHGLATVTLDHASLSETESVAGEEASVDDSDTESRTSDSSVRQEMVEENERAVMGSV